MIRANFFWLTVYPDVVACGPALGSLKRTQFALLLLNAVLTDRVVEKSPNRKLRLAALRCLRREGLAAGRWLAL